MPSLALGEEALSRVPGQCTRGRGCLPRVPCPGTRERVSSSSAREGTRGRIFVFFCFFASFFLWGLSTLFKTLCSNLGQFWLFFYISLVFFISLNFFAYFEFELQVHEIMEFGDSKNYINDIWCMLMPYPGTRMKCRPSCWRNMTNNLWEKCI